MNEEEKLIFDLQMKVAISSSLETKDYPHCIVMKKDLQGLLDLYNKEKEKNKGLRDKSNKLIEVTNLYLDSVPKYKIREKIEEYKKLDKEYARPGNYETEISLLQELLEE